MQIPVSIRSRRPWRRRLVGTAAALAVVVSGGLASLEASPAVAAAGDTSSAVSPPTAADAPLTKTVSWMIDELTPAEKQRLLFGSCGPCGSLDPDFHGQAGYLFGVSRLGIPEIRHADAMGINVFADATAFPTRIGLASSFDRDAFVDLGAQVGREGLATDVDLVYGPQVDLARFPSWSRNLTSNGEDAYLSGEFAEREINGIQSTGLMSQVKHVSFYSGQSQDTPSLVGSQAARELYLLPAEDAIKTGGVTSVMCSYATFRIVGEQDAPQYACSNGTLNNKIVKDEFGLKGFITSDYGGSKTTSDLLAGMDNEFRTTSLNAANLLPLIDPVSSTYSPEYAARADDAVARILYQYERFGLLDNSKIPADVRSEVKQTGDVTNHDNSVDVDKKTGIKLALQMAEESGVLLKNEDALPVSTSEKVAVVGPASTLMPSSPGGERSRGFGDRANITPLKAIKAAAGSSNVVSAPGVDWIGTTVPAANLKTTEDPAAPNGLTRTAVDATGATTTKVDTALNGKQTDLVRGNKYTWTGYLDVAQADTYQLLLQRPYGTDSGNRAAYNQGFRTASAGQVSLAVDGVNRSLANPGGNILQNGFPDGDTAANGQYLGKDNTGISLDLTPGRHQVTLTYNPATNAATTPTFRFAWAPLNANIAAAADAATTADTTLVFVDDSSPGVADGGGDNSSTTASIRALNARQATLIDSVSTAARAAGKKVVVVVNSGGAITMPWASKVDGILEMWYPGQEGGTATANLLYGKANPSGKLPLTFPVDNDSTPFAGHLERTSGVQDSDESAKTVKWTEGVNVGYRWYTDPTANPDGIDPLYAFGHGLSYTSFDYSGLSVKAAAGGALDVSFTVTNTGKREGGTSPQVYLGPSPDLAAPVYDAKGFVTKGFQQSAQKMVQFDHVDLAPGASKNMTLRINTRQLSAWDTAGQKWVLGTGERTIKLGAASDDIVDSVVKNVLPSVVAPRVASDLPATTSAKVGQTVTLTASATGTPAPTQQWQRSTNGGVTWADVPGATGATYSFKVAGADKDVRVRAVFTNELDSTSTTATRLAVTKARSSTTVAAKKVVTNGSKATVRIRVAGAAGVARPTGAVKVRIGSGPTTSVRLDRDGRATVRVKVKGSKRATVKAVYRGDSSYTSSSDTQKVKVRGKR